MANKKSHPEFVDNQTLSPAHLNGILDFLKTEIQTSRTQLSGCGIVCGLEVHIDGVQGGVSLSPGVGVTSDGHLVSISDEYACRYYRNFDDKTDGSEAPFNDSVGADIIEIFDAIPEGDAPASYQAFHNMPAAFRDGVVVVYLSEKVQQADNCNGDSCDNKGSTRCFVPHILLLKRQRAGAMMASSAAFYESISSINSATRHPAFDIPRLKMPRAVLRADIITPEQFVDSYLSAATEAEQRLRAFVGDIEAAWPDDAIALRLNAISFSTIRSRLDVGNSGFQAYYDWLELVFRALNEWLDMRQSLMSGCIHNTGAFVRHVFAGSLVKQAQSPQLYRHYFQPVRQNSQALNDHELLALLAERVVRIHQKVDLNPLEDVAILPEKRSSGLTQDRALPYFLNYSALQSHWHVDGDIAARADFERYGVKHDLLAESLEDVDFLRVEGHVGLSNKQARVRLLTLQQRYNLPMAVRTLYIDSINDKEPLKSCSIEFLSSLYKVYRAAMECSITSATSKLLAFQPKSPTVFTQPGVQRLAALRSLRYKIVDFRRFDVVSVETDKNLGTVDVSELLNSKDTLEALERSFGDNRVTVPVDTRELLERYKTSFSASATSSATAGNANAGVTNDNFEELVVADEAESLSMRRMDDGSERVLADANLRYVAAGPSFISVDPERILKEKEKQDVESRLKLLIADNLHKLPVSENLGSLDKLKPELDGDGELIFTTVLKNTDNSKAAQGVAARAMKAQSMLSTSKSYLYNNKPKIPVETLRTDFSDALDGKVRDILDQVGKEDDQQLTDRLRDILDLSDRVRDETPNKVPDAEPPRFPADLKVESQGDVTFLIDTLGAPTVFVAERYPERAKYDSAEKLARCLPSLYIALMDLEINLSERVETADKKPLDGLLESIEAKIEAILESLGDLHRSSNKHWAYTQLVHTMHDISYGCRLKQISLIREMFQDKIDSLDDKLILAEFLRRKPGIEHRAGVPVGGTLYLVAKAGKAATRSLSDLIISEADEIRTQLIESDLPSRDSGIDLVDSGVITDYASLKEVAVDKEMMDLLTIIPSLTSSTVKKSMAPQKRYFDKSLTRTMSGFDYTEKFDVDRATRPLASDSGSDLPWSPKTPKPGDIDWPYEPSVPWPDYPPKPGDFSPLPWPLEPGDLPTMPAHPPVYTPVDVPVPPMNVDDNYADDVIIGDLCHPGIDADCEWRYIVHTDLRLTASKFHFCDDDTAIALDVHPRGGTLIGDGAETQGHTYLFDPTLAKVGENHLTYSVGDQRVDLSVWVHQHPQAEIILLDKAVEDGIATIKVQARTRHADVLFWKIDGEPYQQGDSTTTFDITMSGVSEVVDIYLKAANQGCFTVKSLRLTLNDIHLSSAKAVYCDDEGFIVINAEPSGGKLILGDDVLDEPRIDLTKIDFDTHESYRDLVVIYEFDGEEERLDLTVVRHPKVAFATEQLPSQKGIILRVQNTIEPLGAYNYRWSINGKPVKLSGEGFAEHFTLKEVELTLEAYHPALRSCSDSQTQVFVPMLPVDPVDDNVSIDTSVDAFHDAVSEALGSLEKLKSLTRNGDLRVDGRLFNDVLVSDLGRELSMLNQFSDKQVLRAAEETNSALKQIASDIGTLAKQEKLQGPEISLVLIRLSVLLNINVVRVQYENMESALSAIIRALVLLTKSHELVLGGLNSEKLIERELWQNEDHYLQILSLYQFLIKGA
ncbi:Uncharacterised protein [BD1-7 clade bacterium]|uniref:Uncharacterized protein n=1 Tax=BD1-7 clade bacterium TaxID=2029982 RepID=A0A5S9QME3_9GAMM|nr:Uncharacterised protein [BD1-7 clade bacterium]